MFLARRAFSTVSKVSMSHPVSLLVTVEVDPNRLKEFRDVIAEDASDSLKNENGGCIRFDVLELSSPSNNKFLFYEVYKNAAALEFHKTTPHFAKWDAFRQSGGVSKVDVDRALPFVLGEERIDRDGL